MMRRMSANNHRGQEAIKVFHQQAGYMRAMNFSRIDDQMSCKRGGSIYALMPRAQDAQERPIYFSWMVSTAIVRMDRARDFAG